MRKPSIVIFSSVQGLRVAQAIQDNLRHSCDVLLWNQGMFEPSGTTLGSILTELDTKDFAIVVMTLDDLTLKESDMSKIDAESLKTRASPTPRDNTVLELGLSIGRLGRERSFLIRDNNPLLKIPSNLNGYNILDFEYPQRDTNLHTAIAYATNQIETVVKKEGERSKITLQSLSKIQDKNIRSFGASILNSASAAIESLTQNEAARMPESEYLEYLIMEVRDLGEDDVLYAICGGKNYELSQVYGYLNENVQLAKDKGVLVHRLYVSPDDNFIDREWEVIDAHVTWSKNVENFKVGVLIGESDCAKLLELQLPHRFGMVLTKHQGRWKSRLHYGLERGQQGGWEFRQEGIILKQIKLFEDLAQQSERTGIPPYLQQKIRAEVDKLGDRMEQRLWRYGQERPL